VLPANPVTLRRSLVTGTIANDVDVTATPLANLVTLQRSLVTVMIASVVDVTAEDVDTVVVTLLANLAMTTRKKLKKQLKLLFSDETWVEVVEDAVVVTPPVNLVKMVLPANLVTLRRSLVTVTIANDVDVIATPPANLVTPRKSLVTETIANDVAAQDGDTARVTLLANLATTKKKPKKPQLKPLFFDETWADAAAVTPLVNLVKTVPPVNLGTFQRSLAMVMLPVNLVMLRKSLVKVMLVNVVAAEDADTDDVMILKILKKALMQPRLRRPQPGDFYKNVYEVTLLWNLLILRLEGMDESADEKKMLQKNHGITKALFANNGEESADVNGSLTPLSPTESLILMVSQEKLSLEKLMKKWRVFL